MDCWIVGSVDLWIGGLVVLDSGRSGMGRLVDWWISGLVWLCHGVSLYWATACLLQHVALCVAVFTLPQHIWNQVALFTPT